MSQDDVNELKSVANSSSIRMKDYTGIELKTLWNHFNKDGVMTISELNALLERIMMKDGSDLMNDLKKTKAWTKFCKSALRVIDTSQGSSVDLAEFTSEFNQFNSNRFFYAVKYLLPAIIELLKHYSITMKVNEDRLTAFSVVTSSEDPKSKELIESLQSKISELETLLIDAQKQASYASDSQSLIDALNSRVNGGESRIAELLEENSRLKKSIQDTVINEWQEKFDQIMNENSELRSALEHARSDLIAQSSSISSLKDQLESSKSTSKNFSATAFGASLSDVELDPFRTELIRQYGSFDKALSEFRVQSLKKISMVEMETMCLSLGYTREYCRKLFYALDTRNRGYLSLEQFSRPLPILNKELCLLLKEEVRNSPKRSSFGTS